MRQTFTLSIQRRGTITELGTIDATPDELRAAIASPMFINTRLARAMIYGDPVGPQKVYLAA